MRGLASFCGLLIFASSAYGMNDLERGAGFFFNLASSGTYLADLEGRKEAIRLEMEKIKAQMTLDVAKESNQMLVNYYKDKLKSLTEILAAQTESRQELQNISANMDSVKGVLSSLVLLSKKNNASLKLLKSTGQDMTEQMNQAADLMLSNATAAQLLEKCNSTKNYSYCVWSDVKKKAAELQGNVKALDDYNQSALIGVTKSIIYNEMPIRNELAKLDVQIKDSTDTLEETKKQIVTLGGAL